MRSHPSAYALLALLLLGSLCRGAGAATYYVAPTGSADTNPGTETAPFRTIAKGLTVLAPGDTLFLRGGVYGETIDTQRQRVPSGTEGAPITLASSPNETAILRPAACSNVFALNAWNTASDIAYLILRNLVFDGINCNDYVITLIGPPGVREPHDILFDGGEAMNASKQPVIQLNGHHNVIRGMQIHDSAVSYGIYMGGHDQLIEDNEIHHNAGYAVQLFDGSPSHDIRNVTLRRNRLHHNGFGRLTATITVNGSYDTQIYNNLIYNNNGGIQVRYGGGSAHYPSDTLIYNNTLYNNNGECIAVGGDGTRPTGTRITNTLCALTGSITDAGGVGTILQTNFITTEPGFVNAAGSDFHVLPGSRTIGSGNNVRSVVSTDYDGKARPTSGPFTIGAYEMAGAVTLPDLPPPSNLRAAE